MKDRNPSVSREPIPLVVLLPIDDHRVYSEALRVLRCLMGRKAPTIETLLLNDLRGRDSDGVADNYLDAINWPVSRGRAITVRLQERGKREDAGKIIRRQLLKLARPPVDPVRN